jgi:hypothetical protein
MKQDRPDTTQISAALSEAEAAAAFSRGCRARWKRRRAPARQESLEDARQRCAAVVPQLRSWLGMVAWGGISLQDELAMKRAVAALRYERRQIDKMLT